MVRVSVKVWPREYATWEVLERGARRMQERPIPLNRYNDDGTSEVLMYSTQAYVNAEGLYVTFEMSREQRATIMQEGGVHFTVGQRDIWEEN